MRGFAQLVVHLDAGLGVLQRVVDLLDRVELHVRIFAAHLAARTCPLRRRGRGSTPCRGCLLHRVDDAALGADDERLVVVLDDVVEQNL